MLNHRSLLLGLITGLLFITACSSPAGPPAGPDNGNNYSPPGSFRGHDHLGEWVWLAVYHSGRTELEAFGYVNFNSFAGSPSDGWRQAITGTWQNCTYGACNPVGPAMLGELRLDGQPWDLVTGFMNPTATEVRLLGAELEHQVIEGQDAYIGIGEYYGSVAAVGLIRPGSSTAALDALLSDSIELSTAAVYVDPGPIRSAILELMKAD